MNKINNTENHTKKLYLQNIVDVSIIALISLTVLNFYETDWLSVHSAKENMLAIHFDMFTTEYFVGAILFMFVIPNAFEFFAGRRIIYKYTSEKKLPGKLVRALKIFLFSLFIILLSVTLTDKYSRVEFYDTGSIIEYNKNNEIANEYNKNDIDSVELRINHDIGRSKYMDYWAEAVVYIGDNYYILRSGDYISPDDFEVNPDTERSLFGLKNVKETFYDKIKIDPENLDVLFEVERYEYTQSQAKKLCEIFEVDFDEMMLWLKEDEGIVLENDN